MEEKHRNREKQRCARKRVEIVSLKMVRESTFLYDPRRISCPADGLMMAKMFLEDKDREEFIVITLDTKNQPTSVNVCSKGSLNASLVHPREVFKTAVISNAATVLLAHNHPSGNPEPSKEDIKITKRLNEAGKILGIKVLDHLIIGSDSYYSFKEQEKI
ncbi:conserved protein of unknown function [Acetoanaerobium sticklandii]|uniref:MPN domain-containing protein n=1 Tax=Acetoanaerobium sticklandii (strain ATCC 12662 / DSM 519 / JCM 1433 / CCUG 9281 / NCIMB 10654 / HF) TaxID=499177 RepID=E3PVU0_ACESD|nr:JAB domain-containing protein [Acetoanaerobium sticklandii]CBH22643.1 conserved protein of unknown function [Acetoanaerobium sticklandii]